jgi:lipopolysaccharide transport system ATP-binding protein
MTSAIRVENLSKCYRIGHAAGRGSYLTLRESLMEGISSTFRRLRGDIRETEEFWAPKGVDFEVRPGEVVGVIGRNGAGKNTLLKVLSRITEPTEGRVQLWGRVASLLEVGTGFHPELSGRENIYLNGAIPGMSRNGTARTGS